MVDTLGILNNIRLFKDIKDGGSHLAYDMMNHLNSFRNKNPKFHLKFGVLLFTLSFLLFTSKLHFHQPVSNRNFIIDNIA